MSVRFERHVLVRPYEPSDRGRVRHVCFATGFMGEPVDWQWRDAESFSDVFSAYYTDVEPQSASVVEIDGVVCGYLLGCIDSRAARNPARIAGRHIVRRGIAFRPGTAGMIWRSVGDVIGDLARRRVRMADLDFDDERWPAHLHIDLLAEARGHGAGQALVRGWLTELRMRQVRGCFLQTMAENTRAIRFFEAMGFERHGGPILVPGMRQRDGSRLHIQAMVQDLRTG